MWFIAVIGSNNRPLLKTYKLFDNQIDAQNYANASTEYTILCCYFPKSGDTYSKKWEYHPQHSIRTQNSQGWQFIQNNNADFTP
jgi:hypothetical protein